MKLSPWKLADRLQEAVVAETPQTGEESTNTAKAVEQANIDGLAASTEDLEDSTKHDDDVTPEQPDSTLKDTTSEPPAPLNTLAKDVDDPLIPVELEERQEVVMGDVGGDLGEKMEAAAEEGKKERIEDERKVEVMGMQVDNVRDLVNGEKRKRDDDEDMEGALQANVRWKIDVANAVNLSTEPNEKKLRSEVTPSTSSATIPSSISHVVHPPTRSLYISNLRRPLQQPELKELLESYGDLDEEYQAGGLWVDNVKSHCYCTVSRRDISC